MLHTGLPLRRLPGTALRRIAPAALLALVAGCAAPPDLGPADPFSDPYEAPNRRIHEFNKRVDQTIVRPLAGSGGDGIGRPVRRGIVNLADNLDTPRRIVNNLLQGRVQNAGHNAFRLAINTVVGVGGLFDPATSIGLESRDTDFGETLHVWGTPEGAYLSVPFLGPSTERDTVGDIVDIALNPLRWTLPVEARQAAGAIRLAGKAAERGEFAGAIDDVLYDSADSYAQTRLIYLQNRRFELARNAGRGGAPAADAYIDPYADPEAPAPAPNVIDPYEDIYAQ